MADYDPRDKEYWDANKAKQARVDKQGYYKPEDTVVTLRPSQAHPKNLPKVSAGLSSTMTPQAKNNKKEKN